jgi:signal transduction histidine kinase
LGTVFLRSILVYQDAPELVWVLGILILWSFLFASESVISVRRPEYFANYLVLQTFLVFLLLTTAGYPDFFANLIVILSMQVMIRLKLRIWVVWLGLCALITTALLVNTYENEVFALVLLYTAGSVFYGFYTQATRKAEVARAQNLVLARELQEANQKLQSYSAQAEGLVVVRERNRLARDLHDSVTQTVFSMTLAAQSASLLLERDPSRVEAQLDHLGQLAGNALSEMQLLISELKPEEAGRQSLATSLRGYLKGGRLPENLSVELDLQGDQLSDSVEEQSLFHIVQEALNNVVKHAQAAKVQVRLHLTEPMWIEVQDDGRGFDLRQAEASGRVGLFSMRERAVEIGWDLQIKTSPGAGTCIRVEKPLRK